MGYFSNGTAGEIFFERQCALCIHDDYDNQVYCPIWTLHLCWNYEAVGKDGDETKAEALETFIPKGDPTVVECKMFMPRDEPEPAEAAIETMKWKVS